MIGPIKIMSRDGDMRRKIDGSRSKPRGRSSPAPSPASGDTAGRSDKVPVTPRQIADAAIEAAKAGAAVAHIHVRDPETGKGARDVALYREVIEPHPRSGVDVVLNLTAGMGGDLMLGSAEKPLPPIADGTDMAGATERLEHVAKLPAGNLHARLRHDEFRRRRLRHDQHAGHAAGDGRA